MAEPGGTVRMCAAIGGRRRKLREEPVFTVSISNTGEEIPQEQIPLLFRRFYRAAPSRFGDGNKDSVRYPY